MDLNISGILKTEGAKLSFEFQERFDEISASCGTDCPVSVKGVAESAGGSVIIKGEGVFCADMLCDRCLAPVKTEVSFKFSENIAKEQTGGNDTAARFISNDVIDIGPLVAESIVSAMPMKVLCREDCKGLCPKCGKNLNEGDCRCESSDIDPRFESLRSLFNVK